MENLYNLTLSNNNGHLAFIINDSDHIDRKPSIQADKLFPALHLKSNIYAAFQGNDTDEITLPLYKGGKLFAFITGNIMFYRETENGCSGLSEMDLNEIMRKLSHYVAIASTDNKQIQTIYKTKRVYRYIPAWDTPLYS